MKRILVLTDFSKRAEHAARYAFRIATKLRASILLCNVIEIPEQVPLPSNSQWGADYNALKEESLEELSQLASGLTGTSTESGFHPAVDFVSYIGLLADVANELIVEKGVDLIVMGSHHSNTFKRLLLGSDTYDVLDKVKCPVMLIPEKAGFRDIQKITYATDLTFGDLNVLRSLTKLAAPFHAKIFVSNVSASESYGSRGGMTMKELEKEVLPQIGYPEIVFNSIIGSDVPKSLLEISNSDVMDILSLVHRKNGFIDNFFQFSISKKLVNSTSIPLIIFPPSFNIQISDFLRNGADQAYF